MAGSPHLSRFCPLSILLSAKSLLPLQDPVLVCKLQVELSWTIANDVYGWGIRPQWSIGHGLMVRERHAWDAQCTYLRMHVLLRPVVRFYSFAIFVSPVYMGSLSMFL